MDNMLEEIGKVIAIKGKYAVVEIQQRSACGHCQSSDSCGTSVLSGLFTARRQKIKLINHLGLIEGDEAVVGINENVLLVTAIMAYMLPLFLMIVFALASNISGFGNGISFIASMSGLFVGMQISNVIMGGKDFESREIVLLRNANEAVISNQDSRSI